MEWGDFLQNAAQQVLDTRLQVYQADAKTQAVAENGKAYAEGQPLSALSSVSPVVWIVGGVAVLGLLFVLLKD